MIVIYCYGVKSVDTCYPTPFWPTQSFVLSHLSPYWISLHFIRRIFWPYVTYLKLFRKSNRKFTNFYSSIKSYFSILLMITIVIYSTKLIALQVFFKKSWKQELLNVYIFYVSGSYWSIELIFVYSFWLIERQLVVIFVKFINQPTCF